MPRASTLRAVSIVATCVSLCGGCTPVRELVAEQPETVHVGELAAIRVSADAGYSVGTGGDVLRLVKRAKDGPKTVYVYRANAIGRETLVLSPREPGSDGCVSCVTVHYFITVVN